MASVRIILDTRIPKKDGTFPVKIRVAEHKDSWRIGTSISLSENDFQLMMHPEEDRSKSGTNKPKINQEKKKELGGFKKKLDQLIVKAYSIIDDLTPFNYKAFNLRFSEKGNRSDLIFLLKSKSEELQVQEKYGSSHIWEQASRIFAEFAKSYNKKAILLTEITPKWLNGFEKWALKETKKVKVIGSKDLYTYRPRYGTTSLAMYLIRVRAIINELISNQEFPATQYPFHKPDNRYGYKIPKSRNNKRPLKLAEIMEIFNYEPSTTTEQFARDIFVFSYLASGMNPIDIFKLKWSDIKNNQFTFVRKKTQNKTGGANKINVQLNEQLWDIINLHGRDRENSIYIFDVIPENASEKEIISHTRTAISSINPNLKKIAKKLNITEEISLYFARHSFSNTLMNSEVPIAFISKQLGHVDIKTTQNYLDSFTSENAFDYQKKLLDFSSIKKKN